MTIKTEPQYRAVKEAYKLALEFIHVLDEHPDMPADLQAIPKEMRMAIVDYENRNQ
jgi:hypothetical protein